MLIAIAAFQQYVKSFTCTFKLSLSYSSIFRRYLTFFFSIWSMKKTAEEANIKKKKKRRILVDTEQDGLMYQACGQKCLLILCWCSEGVDHMM